MTAEIAETHVVNYEEIYRQRYETFRHLDKLRWQMLQIGVASSSIVFAVSEASDIQKMHWLTWLAIGLILSLSGVAMQRIGKGIEANSVHLASAASNVGDTGIPDPSDKLTSVGSWISLILTVTGLASLLFAIIAAF